MNRAIEYIAVTVIGVAFVFLVIAPVVNATAQSIINSANCIAAPSKATC